MSFSQRILTAKSIATCWASRSSWYLREGILLSPQSWSCRMYRWYALQAAYFRFGHMPWQLHYILRDPPSCNPFFGHQYMLSLPVSWILITSYSRLCVWWWSTSSFLVFFLCLHHIPYFHNRDNQKRSYWCLLRNSTSLDKLLSRRHQRITSHKY